MRVVKVLVILLVMGAGAAFAVLNPLPVNVDFYFDRVELPLSAVVVGAFASGAVLGMLAALGAMLGLKRENSRLRRRERLATEEVNNLRRIPVKEH
jgi:putative membrane protein